MFNARKRMGEIVNDLNDLSIHQQSNEETMKVVDPLGIPVKIKLLTLWMMDKENESDKPSTGVISHGIWETISVIAHEGKRVYKFRCVWPFHKDIKLGQEVSMYNDVVIALCHEVKLIHLPKIDVAESDYEIINRAIHF
jgi:hypothetical protein